MDAWTRAAHSYLVPPVPMQWCQRGMLCIPRDCIICSLAPGKVSIALMDLLGPGPTTLLAQVRVDRDRWIKSEKGERVSVTLLPPILSTSHLDTCSLPPKACWRRNQGWYGRWILPFQNLQAPFIPSLPTKNGCIQTSSSHRGELKCVLVPSHLP